VKSNWELVKSEFLLHCVIYLHLYATSYLAQLVFCLHLTLYLFFFVVVVGNTDMIRDLPKGSTTVSHDMWRFEVENSVDCV
jgi:hypothetical protein